MRITNGCADTDISFARTGDGGGYDHTPVQPNECRVFHTDGGNIPLIDPGTQNYMTVGTEWPGRTFFFISNGISGLGDEDSGELLMVLANISQSACLGINNSAGITNPSGTPPRDTTEPLNGGEFTGTYLTGIAGNTDLTQNTSGNEIQGFNFGCYVSDQGPGGGDTHYFYYALIEK